MRDSSTTLGPQDGCSCCSNSPCSNHISQALTSREPHLYTYTYRYVFMYICSSSSLLLEDRILASNFQSHPALTQRKFLPPLFSFFSSFLLKSLSPGCAFLLVSVSFICPCMSACLCPALYLAVRICLSLCLSLHPQLSPLDSSWVLCLYPRILDSSRYLSRCLEAHMRVQISRFAAVCVSSENSRLPCLSTSLSLSSLVSPHLTAGNLPLLRNAPEFPLVHAEHTLRNQLTGKRHPD